LKAEVDLRAEIQVAIITFGGRARVFQGLSPVAQVDWESMPVSRGTPMGHALELAAELIENPDIVPSHAYRPTIVLVSDGYPTDAWRGSFSRLLLGRGGKAERMAMAIGKYADKNMLSEFIGNPEMHLFEASDAEHIHHFFRFLTVSVSSRSHSFNPNLSSQIDPGLTTFQFDETQLGS
jgi:uncharacterized protein YegL